MTKTALKTCVSVAGILAALWVAPAYAQDAAPAADDAAAGDDDIVVTASAGDRTALTSSISVSQIDQAQIVAFTPRSQAEVLRTIPGLNVQDTAGPGGNANIGVRGIPVSTGGSEYVALQEDGLPVTLFGDIQFGNNDYWVRFDQSVDRVEAVRGGSSSTFASQAPGAVINYVSRTGEEDGGSIALSTALNYREHRIDFNYGGRLSDTVRFHIGGFAIDGSGPTHLPYTASRGYQIRGNITKELAEGRGYIRLNFKRLDDREPTFTSMPALATLSGNTITGFSQLPNIDPRRYASTGLYNQQFLVLDRNGTLDSRRMEGIHPVVSSLGGEFHYEFSDHFSVTNKVRWSEITGSFTNQWTGEASTASLIGRTIGDAFGTAADSRVIGSIRYAAGPNLGQLYTSPFISNSAQVSTTFNDVGSLANDLTLSGDFELGGGAEVTARAGWFFMRQTIDMDWRINNVTQSLNSTGNPVPLNLFSPTGTQLSANGATGFNNQWGGCCGGRSYAVDYTNNAPYLSVEADIGGLNLDASVRFDSVQANGSAYAGGAAAGTVTVTDALGTAVLPAFNTARTPSNLLDYSKSYTSWSLGALYEIGTGTSIFARASRGGRFNADRLLYNDANFTSTGQLTAGGDHLSVNYVTQQEIGIKNRGSFGGGGRYRFEVTLYRAQVKESNYDFTAPSRNQNPFIDTIFHSYGVEASGSLRTGPFSVDAYVVYTSAEDTRTGLTPVAMPKWTYLVAPTVDFGPAAAGLSINGQSNFQVSGNITAPGSTFVNGFVRVRPLDQVELSLNVNNLFNRLGYRANNGSLPVRGPVPGLTANQGIFDNSAALGRTLTATVRYSF